MRGVLLLVDEQPSSHPFNIGGGGRQTSGQFSDDTSRGRGLEPAILKAKTASKSNNITKIIAQFCGEIDTKHDDHLSSFMTPTKRLLLQYQNTQTILRKLASN